MLIISEDKCIGCKICIAKCPFDALKMKEAIAVVNADQCTLCGACVEPCPVDAITISQKKKVKKDLEDYKGVWVIAEQRENKLMNVSFELVSEGRKLADAIDEDLSAIVLGSNIKAEAKKLIAYGADHIYIIEDEKLKDYRTSTYTKVITDLIESYKPKIVLLGATHNGRDLGPRLSARLKTGLTADCTKLAIDQEEGILLQTRPAFGGNLMATIICPDHRPQMSTVRPGVMNMAEVDESRIGDIQEVNVNLGENIDLTVKRRIFNVSSDISDVDVLTKIKEIVKAAKASVNLEDADIIVSGGRGVGNPEGFSIIKSLAKALNGEVGASRAVVDEGWIDQDHQVGQTGKTVKPKLYIACGISGAIQHRAGMNGSDYIIAINKDKDADIFGICDYGIVGDLHTIVPLMIKAFAS